MTTYGPTQAPPPSYLGWAILSTVLFFLPLGVAAIVFASRVGGQYAAGDYAGAQDSSRRARQLSLWATVVGIAFWAVVVVLLVAGLLVGSRTSTSY